MTKARIALGTALGAALICGGMAMAQKPVDNISGKKHPNLAAAERLSTGRSCRRSTTRSSTSASPTLGSAFRPRSSAGSWSLSTRPRRAAWG